MIAFFLAGFITVSFPNGDGSITSFTDRDPMPEPYISNDTRIADAAMRGNPVMWQQQQPVSYDPYGDVQRRYPVDPIVPVAQRIQVPMEEQMAMDAYRTRQLGEDTQIRGEILRQKVMQNQFDYTNRSIDQAQQVMQQGLLGKLQPSSPDFDAQVASLQQAYPLAFQNRDFNSQIARLADSHNDWKRSQEVQDRHAQWTNEAAFNAEIQNRNQKYDQIRSRVATVGPEALIVFDGAYKNSGDPDAALAEVTGRMEEYKRKAAESKPMSQGEYLGLIREKNKILDRRKDPTYEWTADDDADLGALQDQIGQFRGSRGISGQAVAPAPSGSAPLLPEGKVISQGGHKFRVTNGVPVLIQ